jgi:hypothetical protein
MPGNGRLWGFNVSEHLTYMIDIALTTEFALTAQGASGSSVDMSGS